MRTVILSLLLSGVAFGSLSTDAFAQKRHRQVVPAYDALSLPAAPLTVNRRSWLDPGTAESKGVGGPAYITASTQFNKTPDQVIYPSNFGNDTLVGQPYVPGRTVPVVEFSTTPAGNVYVDNTLGYQNYYFNPAR